MEILVFLRIFERFDVKIGWKIRENLPVPSVGVLDYNIVGMALFFFVSWLALLVFNLFLVNNARERRRNGNTWIF